MPLPFFQITQGFLRPLRDIASNYPLDIVGTLIHERLSFLHSVVPLPGSSYDYVNAWVINHGFDHQKVVSTLHELSMFKMMALQSQQGYQSQSPNPRHLTVSKKPLRSTQFSSSSSSSLSRPVQSSPGGSTPSPAYGDCTGWCLSVFFNKPCPRLSRGSLCVYDRLRVKLPLKHVAEFNALPHSEQSALTQHFNRHVRPTLTSTQVKFYS